MNSNNLLYFSVLANELHFGKAAQKLHITQPPLSRAIKQLEEELGVTLFERNQRTVVLTTAGEYLKKKSDLILQNMIEAEKEVKRIAKGEIGELNITYVGSILHSMLPQIRDFTHLYPNIHLHLSQYTVYEQIKMLKNKDTDVAFLRTPIHIDGLHLYEVFSENFVLITSNVHRIYSFSKNDLLSLSKFPFILFPRYLASGLYEQIITISNTIGLSPNIVHEVSQLDCIVRMVEYDMGIAILPKSALQGMEYRVRLYELNEVKIRSAISMCYYCKNINPVLHSFVNFIMRYSNRNVSL